jgi:DNA-binding Lrp family transcriptional regulator
MLNEANVQGFGIRETLVQYFHDPSWPRLKARSFTVWVAVLTRNVAFVNFAPVSYREIAAMTGHSRDTVSRGIQELIEQGYLARLPGDGRRNIPSCYNMLRIAEVAEEGQEIKKAKIFGKVVNQVLSRHLRMEEEKRNQEHLKSLGFTDEMLKPVDTARFLQSVEPEVEKALQALGSRDMGKFLQSLEDKKP